MSQRLIGVDVGGTKVSVAVLEGGRLCDPAITPTDLSSSDALVDQLVGVIGDAGPATAVGIGIPSVVDFATGTARSSVNIPLQGVPLRHTLTERLGIPTFVDNDATVAALAEAHDDDMRPIADIVVMFTVGTGVGGGIVIGGRTFRGATGAAAEIGHTIIGADLANGAPAEGAFPQHSSLEYHAAGRALDRLGAARGIGDGQAVVAAAREGNPNALDAMRIVGEALGVGLANAINTFDPDLIVVGGGVSIAGDLLLTPARDAARRFVVKGVGTKTDIRLARYGPQAGVRGATLLAGQELELGR
jgi:glucokinase